MARTARIAIPNYPYHVTQRGNYGQDIFDGKEDAQNYLELIKNYSNIYKLSLLAYCLMNNHVHFIIIPEKKDSLSNVFKVVNMRYAQYINKKRGATGHLWQGRYYSCLLDQSHLIKAIRHIENNPVRAGFIKEVWQWRWSSAAFHSGRKENNMNLKDISEICEMQTADWRDYLKLGEEQYWINDFRKNTTLSRPFGTDKFIDQMEKKLGRKIRVAPRGRPKKRK